MELFAGGLVEKKVYLGGMSLLSILLSLKSGCQILEKDAKFNWSQDCDEVFLTLRKLLTTAPTLAQSDIEKPFDVYYDASGMGIGGVLMQDD
jgi:hypothetical protein